MPRERYTTEMLTEAVAASTSISGVMRYLGIRMAGGSHQHISRKIKRLNLDTSHFKGCDWAKGVAPVQKKTASQILVHLPNALRRTTLGQLRRAMTESGVPDICALCGLGKEWRGLPLTLQIDHIDGDWMNNVLVNLRLLCPNCHTQQVTSRSHRLGRVA